MNSLHCCQRKSRPDGDVPGQKPRRSRLRGAAGLVLPGALLALMPKCPLCLAAYVALCTRFTLSRSSAHLLLRALTALCLATLALCVVRRVVSYRHNKQVFNLQPTASSR